MDICTNCGQKLNKISGQCTHCGSGVASAEINMASAPKTRIEKRKVRSKTKRLVAGVGGLLLILCVTFSIIHFNKHESSTELAVTKTIEMRSSLHMGTYLNRQICKNIFPKNHGIMQTLHMMVLSMK